MIKFFRKYQSIKKYGTDETEGIEMGASYVFPKIDGTNSQLWYDGNILHGGSRNREVSLENDNQGFFAYATQNEKLLKFLKAHPDLRLYGEWLVPHSLKTYRKDAWRKFYVFDVVKELNPNEETEEYIYIYLMTNTNHY